MATKSTPSLWHSEFKTILLAGFVAGTLDLLGAIFVYSVILNKISAVKILRGIAGTALKIPPTSGGNEMIFYGIAVHYIIAFTFTIIFFIIYPYVPFFRRQKILGGLLYGFFIWMIMNLIVLKLMAAHPLPLTLKSVLIGASILMIMIGLPLSFFANKYYKTKNIVHINN